MKFKHGYSMRGKLHKSEIKNGFERKKEKFDNINPGEEVVVSNDEIFGKTKDGKQFVKVITGFEKFVLDEEP